MHLSRWHEKSTEGHRVYAVGDIHGRLDLLEQLTQRIEYDARETSLPLRLVFLGDYIDRGPESAGVIDFFLNHEWGGMNPVFLLGNHEHLLLDCFSPPGRKDDQMAVFRNWQRNGGVQTLASYGVSTQPGPAELAMKDFCNSLPPRHLEFYQKLLPCHTMGDYYFVHAGILPGVPLNQQTLNHQIWIRDEFLMSDEDHGRIIVHGHTPHPHPELEHNRINVDTAAVYGHALTAVRLEGGSEPVFLSVPAPRSA